MQMKLLVKWWSASEQSGIKSKTESFSGEWGADMSTDLTLYTHVCWVLCVVVIGGWGRVGVPIHIIMRMETRAWSGPLSPGTLPCTAIRTNAGGNTQLYEAREVCSKDDWGAVRSLSCPAPLVVVDQSAWEVEPRKCMEFQMILNTIKWI